MYFKFLNYKNSLRKLQDILYVLYYISYMLTNILYILKIVIQYFGREGNRSKISNNLVI